MKKVETLTDIQNKKTHPDFFTSYVNIKMWYGSQS